MDKSELMEKLAKTNLDELWSYHTSAKFVKRTMDVLGVSTLLFMLFFTSLIVLIPGALLVFLFAHISVGVNQMLEFIEERIIKLSDK